MIHDMKCMGFSCLPLLQPGNVAGTCMRPDHEVHTWNAMRTAQIKYINLNMKNHKKNCRARARNKKEVECKPMSVYTNSFVHVILPAYKTSGDTSKTAAVPSRPSLSFFAGSREYVENIRNYKNLLGTQ
jgi:hypothetical protein